MDKTAKLSLSKLKNIFGGSEPLFHMTPKNNAASLIKSRGTIYSPAEAIKRGVANKFPVTGTSHGVGESPVSLSKGRAFISRRTMNKIVEHSGKKYRPTRGTLGEYELAKDSLMKTVNSHSPDAIHVSRKAPLMQFGGVGVMAGKDGVKGNVLDIMSRVKIMPQNAYRGDELAGSILPQFKGTMLYDPTKFSREEARKIKDAGGVAFNSRFRRKIKAYNKAIATPK